MREQLFHDVFTSSPQKFESSLAGLVDAAGTDADQQTGITHAYLRFSEGQAQSGFRQERTAKKVMLENLDSGVQISDVAQACCLSRSHFSRTFKNSTGHSPRDWLKLVRLNRAMELLEQTDLPITQISLECGFSDQAHFTRSFSKEFGLPPRKWRVKKKLGL